MSWLMLGGLMYPGCALFEELKDAVDSLTEPIVMNAIVVGLEMDGLDIDLTGTEFESGSSVQVWLTDANANSGVGPARGASVTFVSDANGSFGLSEAQPGYYTASGEYGIDYSTYDDIEMVTDYGGERRRITMRTPAAADVQIPTERTAGMGLSIDLRGQDFDNAVVILADVTEGRSVVVWESDYDETQPRDASNLVQSIDGTAFKPNRLYIVGVVGLVAARESNFHGVQNLTSGMMAGSMVLSPVSTFEGFDTGF